MCSDLYPKKPYWTIAFGNAVFTPHYELTATYVGPGFPKHTDRTYTWNELVRRPGARIVSTPLWQTPQRDHSESILYANGGQQ